MSGFDLAGVSRETLDRLAAFEGLVHKWNPVINLVARSTLPDIRARHTVDSLQLAFLAPANTRSWVDLGSGGGFPGLIVAIVAPELLPGLKVTLSESDQRKSAFLRTVVRELSLCATVVTARVEAVPPLSADVVSARALAPLDRLIAYAERHLTETGVALFPKGAAADQEIEEALEHWRFSLQKTPSKTDPAGVVLRIGGIARV